MSTPSTFSEEESDFGHTVPGARSGEGSRSILPYLKNSLKVNPNVGIATSPLETQRQSQLAKRAARPKTREIPTKK